MIKEEWLKKAETDGLYAIACALIELSDNVDRIGLNRNTNTECMGTTEKMAVALEKIADTIDKLEQ